MKESCSYDALGLSLKLVKETLVSWLFTLWPIPFLPGSKWNMAL